MATIPLVVSVPQNGGNGKGICPQCGSPLAVACYWLGGVGYRLCVRCTMTQAPIDATGERWCNFGPLLEGNEHLFAKGGLTWLIL